VGPSFYFEVFGPDTIAVPVDLGLSGLFDPIGFPQGGTCTDNFVGNSFVYECSNAEIISPGWYYTALPGGGPAPPLQTGEVLVPVPWLVPNEWNTASIGASVGADSVSDLQPLVVTAGTAMQLRIDPSFPDAASYQIVIAPEPASWGMVVVGLLALGIGTRVERQRFFQR
jgi:hypothetical protein